MNGQIHGQIVRSMSQTVATQNKPCAEPVTICADSNVFVTYFYVATQAIAVTMEQQRSRDAPPTVTPAGWQPLGRLHRGTAPPSRSRDPEAGLEGSAPPIPSLQQTPAESIYDRLRIPFWCAA